MRHQTGLILIEVLLILVAIVIISGVGWYVCSARQEAGKSLDNVGSASEYRGEQARRQKDRPKETDETADWATYVSSESKFSLRHPKYWAVGPLQSLFGPRDPQCTRDSFFAAGADIELVAECGTCYMGQIYVLSKEGNELSSYRLTTSEYPHQNLTSQKVTIDKIEGTRETGTAMGQMDEKFDMPGLPDGTKVVIYLFYAHGRTYIAEYNQRIDEPDILRDFDLMITKTLKFSN